MCPEAWVIISKSEPEPQINYSLECMASAEFSSIFSVVPQFAVVTKTFIFYIEGINIPADQPITKLKNLEDVVIPTMEIKVIGH